MPDFTPPPAPSPLDEKAGISDFYPKYLCHNNSLFIKVVSPTKVQQIAGNDYGNGNWNWQSSSYECSCLLTEGFLQSEKYIPISELQYNDIRSRYLDFHRKLLK